MQHFILTRFDVHVQGWSKPTSEWIAHRNRLFEKFCLPSVVNQSSSDFKWLVFFDGNEPEHTAQIRRSACRFPFFTPILLQEQFSFKLARTIVRSYRQEVSDLIITSRLDNDDAVCRDYVETVQTIAEGGRTQTPFAINFSNGWVMSSKEIRASRQPSNPFLSLVESGPDLSTVWAAAHHNIGKLFPIVESIKDPAWLQIIHEKNKSNIMQGEVLSDASLNEKFPWAALEVQGASGEAGDRPLYSPCH